MVHTPSFAHPIIKWIDSRLPIFTMLHHEYNEYPMPRNVNYLWAFGAIAALLLLTMIVTGLMLAMQYNPSATGAFDSVERIMRDVNYGWLLRYMHANGGSMFFIAVYIHIFRGLYYGSYQKPRELVWMIGVVLMLLMMATAFMGYVLPWGQMSFWGATVITNLFSAFPFVGDPIVTWLWGGFSVDNPTLNRFFALHFLLPFVILAVVMMHTTALHIVGSNCPTGVPVKGPEDSVPFNPYVTVKDLFAFSLFLIFYCSFIFFLPNFLGHPDNYTPANPMVTPPHIVPEWYFLPFYAILRAIPDKLMGVVAMFASIAVLLALPWLDTSKVRSNVYRPINRILFWILVVDCILLGWCGAKPPEGIWVILSRVGTLYYFGYFLVALPLLGRFEKTLPVPETIAEAIRLKHERKAHSKAAPAAVASLLFAAALMVGLAGPARASGGGVELPHHSWPQNSIFGRIDQAAAKRGLQIYREICSGCHSLRLVPFRALAGIGFSEDEIKAIAAEYTIKDGPDKDGAMFDRPGRPADRFPSPFPNDNAARAANNGALPPDLSLIIKARGGQEDYVTALLTGYEDEPPHDVVLPEGAFYNHFFPGHLIRMPKMLQDGGVTYADGAENTALQQAKDVSTFLWFTAEPHHDYRKQLGVRVILFLFVFSGLLYASKRMLWRNYH